MGGSLMNNKSLTSTDTHFDSFWLSGCVIPRRAYQVSSLNSAIFLSVENLSGPHEILLELDDHPAHWDENGLIAVSILVNRHGEYLLGSNGQIQTLQSFKDLAHLPRSSVGSVEMVIAVQQWLQSCPYPALQDFLLNVLGQPDIGCGFFSRPASASHHHCYPGGLAQHSLEVARSVYAVSGCFDEHERWLAAVAGLLHDLGKVRTFYPDGRRTEVGHLITHELIGFELIGPALSKLDDSWPDGANMLRYLFDWLLHPRQQRPMLPIALTIKQADVMSAAADNRQRAFRDKPRSHSFAKHAGPGPASVYWLPSPP